MGQQSLQVKDWGAPNFRRDSVFWIPYPHSSNAAILQIHSFMMLFAINASIADMSIGFVRAFHSKGSQPFQPYFKFHIENTTPCELVFDDSYY